MKRFDMQPDMVFTPQPMHIIGTKNEDGTPNFSIITWVGFSWDGDPHIMMTIGGPKQTKTNILREKKFSANLISENILWLADYFGCTPGGKPKTDVPYGWHWGKVTDVPTVDDSPWVYECEVDRIIPLDGADLFMGKITNIQINEELRDMDLTKIDLCRLKPAIYSPYQYFSVGEKLGEMGEWKERLQK